MFGKRDSKYMLGLLHLFVQAAAGNACQGIYEREVARKHLEVKRSMPYGHRLLLPVRRVIATCVVFARVPKNASERLHSQGGLDGVTIVVENIRPKLQGR